MADKRNLGPYRNERLDVAHALQNKRKLKDALQAYLEVCYLDVNLSSQQRGKFELGEVAVGPGIIWEVRELSESLGLQAEEVKSLFMERAQATYTILRLPIDPARGWEGVRIDLKVAPGETSISW